MKINPSAGFEQYKAYVQKLNKEETAAGKAGKTAPGAAGNTDKVTISEGAAARAEFGRAAGAMAAEVEGMAGAERLGRLKAAVESGEYAVPAGTVADAILGYEE